MQFTTVPELPPLPTPEAVAKTDKSVTLRLKTDQLDKKFKCQVVRQNALMCFA
jgi:hypothetical protein